MNEAATNHQEALAGRYHTVLAKIAAVSAQRQAGADRLVRLLAVSKGQPASAMRQLFALGQESFGENYAQELAAKRAALADLAGLKLVYIGRLQSNKIAGIVRNAAAIQSLASERHARLVAAAAEASGVAPYPVHLLINAGDEASKDGLSFSQALELAAVVAAQLPALELRGVMAIPPPLANLAPSEMDAFGVPRLYRQLRQLADQVGRSELSLGMSGDLAAAVLAGSDCVRIGTALFGERLKAIALATPDLAQ